MASSQIIALARISNNELALLHLDPTSGYVLLYISILMLASVVLIGHYSKSVRNSEQLSAQLGRALEQSFNEIYLFDAKTLNFFQVNHSARQNLGYTMDELTSFRFLDLNSDFTSEGFEALCKPLKEGNQESIYYKTKFKRKNETLYPVEIRLQLSNFKTFPVYFAIVQDISEKIEAEASLRLINKELEKSKTYLEVTLQSAVDGIVTIDDQGIIETFNKAAENIFGYSSSEVIGENINLLMPEPYKSQHDQYLKNYLETGKANILNFSRELVGLRKDGTEFPLDLAVNEMFLGKHRKYIGSIRDITGRKKVERELHKLSQAVEQSPSTVLITDPKGNIEYVNPKFVECSGYTFEEVKGKNPRILKSKNVKSGRYDQLWEVITKGKEWRGEFQNTRKNGEEYWEYATISPIFNEKGEIAHYLSLKEDISERKHNEKKLLEYSNDLESMVAQRTAELNKALAQSEEARDKIDGILKSVSDGLVVTDVHNRVILMNPAAEDMLGTQLSEIINQPLDFAIRDETLRNRIIKLLGTNSSNFLCDFELSGPGSDQSRIMQAKTSMIQDQNGSKTGVVTIMHDVTNEREVDRLKTEFLSTAAHELRTPLTTIQGFSEILLTKKSVKAEDKSKYLTYIHEEAEHLGDIINDLLDISRIESGSGFYFNKKICTIRAVFNRALCLIQEHSTRHSFEVIWPDDIDNWFVDEGKMNQVLLNVYSNAVKYSPDGGQIRTFIKQSDDYIQVAIKDNGTGMTPEQLENIFAKFYRADSTSKSTPGTGLGMTIVKYIVEAHGGKIWVDSDYGKGTTVNFMIPLI